MNIGTVKWYNILKGYGFIQKEDGNDIFVHRTGLINSGDGLEIGQKVSYEVKDGPKGSFATGVFVVE